jgi:serine/threonine protein kinase
LRQFKDEFGNNTRLRNHIDENKEENVLVFEYFKSDLLSFMTHYPYHLPVGSKKAILKEVGLALVDIHAKNWVHLGRYNTIKVGLALPITLR